jgi:hypothetical protein
MPHVTLNGISGPPAHGVASQVWPGRTQTPQLGLQHSSPTLHVLGPHETLATHGGTPQSALPQLSPGSVQMPQLALQHTCPTPHVIVPHATPVSASACSVSVFVASDAAGARLIASDAVGAALAPDAASATLGGSTGKPASAWVPALGAISALAVPSSSLRAAMTGEGAGVCSVLDG